MIPRIDTSGFQDADSIVGEDTEDTEFLLGMSSDARQYIQAFPWAKPIRRQLLAFPVDAEPTPEHVDMLRYRIDFLRRELIRSEPENE